MKIWVIKQGNAYMDKRTGNKAVPSFGPLTKFCAYGSKAEAQAKIRRFAQRKNPILDLHVEERECRMLRAENFQDFMATSYKQPDVKAEMEKPETFCVLTSEYGYLRSLSIKTFVYLKPENWFGGKVKICATPEEFLAQMVLGSNFMELFKKSIVNMYSTLFPTTSEAEKQFRWGKDFMEKDAMIEVYEIE